MKKRESAGGDWRNACVVGDYISRFDLSHLTIDIGENNKRHCRPLMLTKDVMEQWTRAKLGVSALCFRAERFCRSADLRIVAVGCNSPRKGSSQKVEVRRIDGYSRWFSERRD
jgi:hypothetical protein